MTLPENSHTLHCTASSHYSLGVYWVAMQPPVSGSQAPPVLAWELHIHNSPRSLLGSISCVPWPGLLGYPLAFSLSSLPALVHCVVWIIPVDGTTGAADVLMSHLWVQIANPMLRCSI